MIYIIGCCCFVLVALASLWFGYYVICYHNKHELPVQLTVVSLAGGLLLWEMIKSFRFNTSLPKTFKPITEEEYPALFDIINEVTRTLNLSPIRKVYISPDATAAVFIQPQLRNLIFEPQRNLVVGLGFLTQMDDDEIRAMLYHEFGHYAQEEMKNSISVYTIGQFSRSFVSIKELKKQGTWDRSNGFGSDPRIVLLMKPESGPTSASISNAAIMYRYLENNIGSGATFKRAHYPDLYAGAYAGSIDAYNPLFTMEELYFMQAEAYYWLGNKSKACELAKEATQWNIQRHLDFYLWKSGGIYPTDFTKEDSELVTDEYKANMWKARFESYVGAFLNNEKTVVEYVSGVDSKTGAPKTSKATAKACTEFGNERWFFNASEYTLSDLMMQKYIAMYMQPEQWNDMRRYHYSNNRNGYGIGGNNEIVYPTLRRPYNLYSAYWVDGLTDAQKENTWIQRLNYDPQTEDIYNKDEVVRVGAYKDYKWLQKPMIWAQDAGVRTSLTK